jgi:glycosyltransferase involved in cell wall biosynthesis
MMESASTARHVLMLVENNSYPRDTRVRAQAEALRAAGYKVSVISPADKGQPWREPVNGIAVYRFPQPFEARGFLGYVWEYLYSTIAMWLLSVFVWLRGRFHIIHAANPSDTLVFIAAGYKPFGVRFIFDHHDLSPELYDANCGGRGNPVVRRVLLWLEQLSCRVADHVIATNESYREIEMTRGGVPADRITIVRNGPDLTRFRAVEPDPSLRREGSAVIAYVGAMGFHDGLDCLIRALDHLLHDFGRSDFSCVLIGKGEAIPSLKRLVAERRLTEHVRFTGWISEADKIRHLCTADICVDPDPWNPFNDRSTMIKIAEYMALGKPIVAFDLRENRFTAGEAALYATANDERDFARSLMRLMDDPQLREKMGAFGRKRVETDLAWSHSVASLLSAYRTVLVSREPERARDPHAQATSQLPGSTAPAAPGASHVRRYLSTFIAAAVAVYFTLPYAMTGFASGSGPLSITTVKLPEDKTGNAYPTILKATGGVPPFFWSIVERTAPPAVETAASERVTGVPMAPGRSEVTVRVKDAANATSTAILTLKVLGAPSPLWSADFETGDLSQWRATVGREPPGGGEYNSGLAANVVSRELAYSGSSALKMTIETPPESGARVFRWRESQRHPRLYYGAWFYFPQRFSVVEYWNVWQWKSRSSSGNQNDPFFILNVANRRDGAMYFYLYNWQLRQAYQQHIADIPVGRWIYIEAYYHCTGENDGRVSFWQDGTLLFDVQNVQTRYLDGDCEWSVANYSSRVRPSPTTVYVDDVVIYAPPAAATSQGTHQ